MLLEKFLINRPTLQEELEEQYIEAKQLLAYRMWYTALKLYHKIMTVQRNKLGKDHLDCGKTFNYIDVVLIKLGGKVPASNALKETFHI